MTAPRRPIAERHLASLWAAIRDAFELVETGELTALFQASENSALLRSLAADTHRLAEALDTRLTGEVGEHKPAAGPEPRRPRVLLVDDEPAALSALSELLSDDFEVSSTADPAEAAQWVREEPPDALLTDLRMPGGIDGVALLDLLATAPAPSPPVLIMTALADERQKVRAFEHGAFDFLNKPVNVPELIARLNRAIAHARQLNRERLLQQTDDLTGLLNRRALRASLVDALLHGRDHAEPVAVAIVDQDGLKAVNDRFGHAAGDRSIVCIAHALGRARRASDSVARLGGDEFAVVMPNTTLEGANRLLERLTQELRNSPIEVGPGDALVVEVSYGVAAVEPEENDGEGFTLLAQADARLYAMKRTRQGQRPRSLEGSATAIDAIDVRPRNSRG